MQPNILFIIIDGFRADKFYGENKTSVTPHIDSLIKNGAYFTQAISSSDGTFTCVGSLFSAKYPSKSGLTTFYNHSKATKLFDMLSENGYHTYATAPDVSFWRTLTSKFDYKDLYPKPYVYLYGGTGKQILGQLDSKDMKEPWIYYIHIMDLHRSVEFALPENFKDIKYGTNDYDKMLSAIDPWIGKFLEKIDLNKTLVILTSDHGDLIPISSIGHEINFIPTLVDKSRTIKRLIPKFLQPITFKVFLFARYVLTKLRTRRLKQKLSDYEMRTLQIRGHNSMWDMFDEVFRIPLVFSGYGIQKPKIIPDQVRQVDIFPTILDMIGLSNSKNSIDGRSLMPLIHGEKLDEIPAYIENMATNSKKLGNSIGIRTSKYKYYRARIKPNKRAMLFDLENDPMELDNLANIKLDIVEKMEDLLSQVLRNSTENKEEKESAEETEKIREELKRLGYV